MLVDDLNLKLIYYEYIKYEEKKIKNKNVFFFKKNDKIEDN